MTSKSEHQHHKADPKPDDPGRLAQHAEATRVAEYLRSRGLPVMGVELQVEDEIGVTFRLPNGALHTVSHAAAGAVEHLDAYAEAYVAACEAMGREPIEEA